MKNLLKLAICAAAVTAMFSCSKPEPIETPMDVTANNIAGVWELSSWSGGLPDGCYVYIEFTRRDQTFTIYENLDTFSARKVTGRFHIDLDEELGAVIRGDYDYGNGQWSHRYIVRGLDKQQMTWVAKDDNSDVSVYTRCDKVPDQILEQTASDNE